MYLAELRKLAVTCDWTKEQLGNNLRDKFVIGLHNERLLQQLLTQDHKKSLDELFVLHKLSKQLRKTHREGPMTVVQQVPWR